MPDAKGNKFPHEEYLETIARVEPEIAMIDPGAFYASAAISLKRIADAVEAYTRLTAHAIRINEVADNDKHDDWLIQHRLGDLIEDEERRAAAIKRVMPHETKEPGIVMELKPTPLDPSGDGSMRGPDGAS